MNSQLYQYFCQTDLLSYQGNPTQKLKPVSESLETFLLEACRRNSSFLRHRFVIEDGQIKTTYWWTYSIIKDYLIDSSLLKQFEEKIAGEKGKKKSTLLYEVILSESCSFDLFYRLFPEKIDHPSILSEDLTDQSFLTGSPSKIDLAIRRITSDLYQSS